MRSTLLQGRCLHVLVLLYGLRHDWTANQLMVLNPLLTMVVAVQQRPVARRHILVPEMGILEFCAKYNFGKCPVPSDWWTTGNIIPIT